MTEPQFKMVEAQTSEGLEHGVNKMLDQGWSLHGSVWMAATPIDGITRYTYVQALIRVPNLPRRDARNIIVAWLDETVGVSVSEHVDSAEVNDLLDRLGWPTGE